MIRRLLLVSIVGLLLVAAEANSKLPSFEFDKEHSSIYLKLGKSGFLTIFGAGHEHAVIPIDWSGRLEFSYDKLGESLLVLSAKTSNLRIDSPDAIKISKIDSSPDEEDVAKIQADMISEKVLHSSKFPEIVFKSDKIRRVGRQLLEVKGKLSIHGKTNPVTFQMHIESSRTKRLRLWGEFETTLTSFGVEPPSVGGVVNVEDEITFHFNLLASLRN